MAVNLESSVGSPPVPTVNLPASFDSMLGSLAAAEQAIARVASDIKTMMEAQARASENFSRTVEDNKKVMQSLEKAVKDSVENQRVAFETRGRTGGISEGGTLGGMSPSGARQQREVDALAQAQADYRRAKSQPFSTMREDLFGRMAEGLSSRQEGFMIDPSGQVRTSGGQFVSAEDASRIQGLRGRQEFLQTFAESGAQSAILRQFPQLAGALKLAGVAGAVVGAANVAAGQFESQREEARGYQQALGISNVEAQRQRLSQFGFRTRMMGTMGDAQANRLFDDLTALGMSGERREVALDFAVSSFREFGMDTADAVALVSAANRRGVESFEQLTDALRGVTEAAAQSGVSAEAARDSFTSLYTSMSSQISQSGAMAISGALATTQAQLGPGFQGLGFDVLDENMIRTMAAAQGLTYNEMLQSLGDPSRAAGIFRSQGARAQDILGSNVSAGAQQELARLINERSGGRGVQAISQSDFREIGRQLLPMLPDVAALRSVYEYATGIDASTMAPDQLAGLVLMELSGAGQLSQVAGELEANVAAAEVMDIETTAQYGADRQGEVFRQLFGEYGEAFERQGSPFTRAGQASGRAARERSALAQRYSSIVAGRGGVGADPIVARLIAESQPGDMFEVSVDGQRRVVDLQTLITQFPDKILEGSAVRATGSRQGESIGDIYGFGRRDVPREVMEGIDLEGRTTAGMSWEESLAEMSNENGVIAGRVYVEPTPQLARYLSFFEAGTIDQQAARTNIVPSAAPVGG